MEKERGAQPLPWGEGQRRRGAPKYILGGKGTDTGELTQATQKRAHPKFKKEEKERASTRRFFGGKGARRLEEGRG